MFERESSTIRRETSSVDVARDPVVVAARDAFASAARGGGSHVTPLKIVKAWRSSVQAINENCFQIGVLVASDLKVSQIVDVVDTGNGTAYSLKIIGRDSDGELYRDVVKVLFWNNTREPKIKRLVFMTEETWGRKYLDTPVVQFFIDAVSMQGVQVYIEYVGRT